MNGIILHSMMITIMTMNNINIPLNDIIRIELVKQSIIITYNDKTKRIIKNNNDVIVFEKDYINNNNSPIIDHCI